MRLTALSLEDFMSWADLDLDLSAVDVLGIGGRVGSGKSAILDGWRFALFGEGRSSPDAMIREEAKRAVARVEFLSGSQVVTVTRERVRGEATALSLEVDGRSLTRHTIAETQAAIIDLLGVSAEALEATAVMVQGRSDEFVRLRPAERTALLSNLVLTDPYPVWHEEAKRQRDAARQAATAAEGRRQALAVRAATVDDARAGAARLKAAAERAGAAAESSATALQEVRDRLTEARSQAEQATRTAERRAVLLGRLRTTEARRVALEGTAEQHAAHLAVPEPLIPPRTIEPADVQAAEASLEEAREAQSDAETLAEKLASAVARYEMLKANSLVDREVPCHAEGIYATCPLLVHLAKPEEIERSAEAVRALGTDVERRRGDAAGLVAAKARLVEVKAMVGDEDLAVAQSHRAHDAWQVRIEEATRGARMVNEELARLDAQTAEDRAEIEQLGEADPTTAPQEVEAAEARVREQERLAADDRSAASRMREAAAVAARDLGDAETAARLMEEAAAQATEQVAREERYGTLADAWHPYGIPRQIMEEAIPAVEAHANEILGRLPGGYGLRLSTRREKRSGAGQIDTLDLIVERRGRERDYSLLSGGERFRVDLALRLGVAGLLTERSGRRVETLWLDEPLGPTDDQEREAVVDAVGALSDEFGLIVVVSHDREFSDRLPWELAISKDEMTEVSHAELRRR